MAKKEPESWSVSFEVFSFESKEAACLFREFMTETIIAHPAMAEYGMSTGVKRESP